MFRNTPFWIRTLNAEAETGGSAADTGEHSNESEENSEQTQEPSTGKGSNDSVNDFSTVFGDDKTPADVKADLEKWRKHAKTWEDRAGKSKKDFENAARELEELKGRPSGEELDGLKQERDDAVREIRLLRALIDMGQDVPALTDSRSFMDQAQALDVEDEDFREKLGEIIGGLPKRSRNTPFGFRERTPGDQQKKSLWSLVHGDSENSS